MRSIVDKYRSKEQGLTLIEMLVVAPMVILLIAVIIAAITALTGSSLQVHQKNIMIYNVQNALNEIEAESLKATAFLDTTGPLTSPQGKDDTNTAFTSTTTGEPDTLIIKRPAATDDSFSPDREVVYYDSPNDCSSPDLRQNDYFPITTVYFVEDSTLWKRTIQGPNASDTCGTIAQEPSCSAAGLASTPVVCKVEDEKILEGVDGLEIKYFADATSAETDTVPPDEASSIDVSIDVDKLVAGDTIDYSGSFRVSTLSSGGSSGGPSDPPPGNDTVTFNYTGVAQTWTVPSGVTSIQIECWGAAGNGDTGKGGYVKGTLAVTAGQILRLYVGQAGITATGTGYSDAAYNGGGNGSYAPSGSGGGASDVRTTSSLSSRVIVAGGGGGYYYLTSIAGGNGGGLSGSNGNDYSGYPGTGGGGGTQSSGGPAATYDGGGGAIAGTAGQGGYSSAYGGGGGGGYFGGGGGNAGGGGGGSSYIGGVTAGTTTPGVRSGNGQVVITY